MQALKIIALWQFRSAASVSEPQLTRKKFIFSVYFTRIQAFAAYYRQDIQGENMGTENDNRHLPVQKCIAGNDISALSDIEL
ncbi:MAG: hypothetical protein ACRCUT_08875, partial [Spirochaetota bacterium]